MRLYTAYGSTRLNTYPVHDVGAGGDDGTEFVPVYGLGRPGFELPGQPGDLVHVDARFGHDRDEVRRSSRGAHMPSIPAFCTEPEVSPQMRRIQWRATLVVNTSPESCHSPTAASRDVRRHRRLRIRVRVQVDVIPAQRPGLLSPDARRQGQDHYAPSPTSSLAAASSAAASAAVIARDGRPVLPCGLTKLATFGRRDRWPQCAGWLAPGRCAHWPSSGSTVPQPACSGHGANRARSDPAANLTDQPVRHCCAALAQPGRPSAGGLSGSHR